MNASLSEKLSAVKWGEFRLGDLFTKRTIKGVPKNKENLTPNKNGFHMFGQTTLIISKKPGNTGISRDIRTEFTTDLLLSD